MSNWNKERVEKIFEQFNAISGKSVNLKVVASEKFKCMVWLDAAVTEVYFSEKWCNDENMPEEIVLSEFIFAYACLLCYLDKDNRMESVNKIRRQLHEKISVEFKDDEEVESYKRVVRRKLYPDSPDGCYFHVGDKLRCRPGGGLLRYVITEINPITDEGIMVHYKCCNSDLSDEIYVEEEAALFRDYIVVAD